MMVNSDIILYRETISKSYRSFLLPISKSCDYLLDMFEALHILKRKQSRQDFENDTLSLLSASLKIAVD